MSFEIFIKFIFKTIKLSVRDMFILPLANLKEMLIISIALLASSGLTKFFTGYSFLDWRGVLVAFLILLVLFLTSKNPK